MAVVCQPKRFGRRGAIGTVVDGCGSNHLRLMQGSVDAIIVARCGRSARLNTRTRLPAVSGGKSAQCLLKSTVRARAASSRANSR